MPASRRWPGCWFHSSSGVTPSGLSITLAWRNSRLASLNARPSRGRALEMRHGCEIAEPFAARGCTLSRRAFTMPIELLMVIELAMDSPEQRARNSSR